MASKIEEKTTHTTHTRSSNYFLHGHRHHQQQQLQQAQQYSDASNNIHYTCLLTPSSKTNNLKIESLRKMIFSSYQSVIPTTTTSIAQGAASLEISSISWVTSTTMPTPRRKKKKRKKKKKMGRASHQAHQWTKCHLYLRYKKRKRQ